MLLHLIPALAACHREAPQTKPPEPPAELELGRAPLHRLNHAEYDNTLRDLIGITGHPSELLPADEISSGFDNVAQALSLTSSHMEFFERGIDESLDELFGRYEITEQYGIQGEGPGVSYTGTGRPEGTWAYLIQDGSILTTLVVAYDGTFEVDLRGFAVGEGASEVSLWIDGAEVDRFVFSAPSSAPEELSTQLELDDGAHRIEIVVLDPSPTRAAGIDGLQLTGPLDPEDGPSSTYSEIVTCDLLAQTSCPSDVLSAFLRRAWRRPASDEAVAWAVSLYDEEIAAGGTVDDGLRQAMKAILLSPEFLYRPELADSPQDGVRALDGYEIASRLSYFLWSTTPDDVLLDSAGAGELQAVDAIEAQVDRMLADDRSGALIDNLAAQWLDLRELEQIQPDPVAYPLFDELLRTSMQQELRALATDFMDGTIALPALLARQEATIDRRLAEHYAVAWPGGEGMARISLSGTGRLGLLGTAGWLATHSHTDSPSAVRRGKWILSDLLCTVPPPPPPNVEVNLEPSEAEGSVREQEEAIRSGEPCAGCHAVMDPLGFALGDFDGIGAERAVDELGYPVDTTVTIDGRSLTGLEEVVGWIEADPRLPRCVVEKTFTYALGRPPAEEDQAHIDAITADFVDGGLTFPALIEALTTHPVFSSRGPYTEPR